MWWGGENPGVVQGVLQPQQGHRLAVLSPAPLAGLEGWEEEAPSLRVSRGGWEQAVGSVPSPSLRAHLLPAAFRFHRGWGQAWQGERCAGSRARRLVSASGGRGWRKPSLADGRGASRASGTAGQGEPRGTIQTLSFSSRSLREEAGSAPNCCRFSPRFSRHPCSGLRGAGKVVPTSLPPSSPALRTVPRGFPLPAPCLAPCTPLRFPCRFWSCRVSPQRFAWPHRSSTPLPCSRHTHQHKPGSRCPQPAAWALGGCQEGAALLAPAGMAAACPGLLA